MLNFCFYEIESPRTKSERLEHVRAALAVGEQPREPHVCGAVVHVVGVPAALGEALAQLLDRLVRVAVETLVVVRHLRASQSQRPPPTPTPPPPARVMP